MTKRSATTVRNAGSHSMQAHGRGVVMSATITADERAQLERMAELGLPDFERVADCLHRQHDMLRRLVACGWPDLVGNLAGCTIDFCAEPHCKEGCHLGSRRRRYETVTTAATLMEGCSPYYEVTIVHPAWRQPVGHLRDMNINGMGQWNYRVLAGMGGDNIKAVGIREATLNRERDGTVHWAGEIQQIVAGASKLALKEAFGLAIPDHYRRPYDKPVMVNEVPCLGRKLGYAQKHWVEQRVAYLDPRTGRQGRNHLPPKDQDWAEHDAWLLSLPLGARTIAYGCGRRGQKLFPVK